MNPATTAACLRSLGDAIVNGRGALEAIVDDYFSVSNGELVGCCALGSAYLTVDPSPLTLKGLPDHFGKEQFNDPDPIGPRLIEAFPVLSEKRFTAQFLALCEMTDDELSNQTLMTAIAAVHDRRQNSDQLIQAGLFTLAANEEASDASWRMSRAAMSNVVPA